MEKKKKVRTTIMLTPELRETLKDMAEDEGRSLSGQIQYILSKAIECNDKND